MWQALKRKEKGEFGRESARGRKERNLPSSLSLPLRTPATQARGARISSLPTNACSTEDNIPFRQSRCTFQILESWPWPQGNPMITRSAWNFQKPSWPLINVRLGAAKVRFTQSDFRILRVLHNLSEGKKRRKKVTLGSGSGSRFYTITSLSVVFNLSTLYLKTVDWSLTSRI